MTVTYERALQAKDNSAAYRFDHFNGKSTNAKPTRTPTHQKLGPLRKGSKAVPANMVMPVVQAEGYLVILTGRRHTQNEKVECTMQHIVAKGQGGMRGWSWQVACARFGACRSMCRR